MRYKAVLGIKINGKNRIRNYRIQDEQGNTRDVPIEKIKEVLQKGINIEGLKLTNSEIVETTEISKIPELKSGSVSLYDWCLQNGERGQRILTEFIAGDNNFNPDQVSYASNKYANFKCSTCGNINNQIIANKTKQNTIGCKYCSTARTSFGEQLIYLWLQSQGFEVYNQYKIQTPLGNKEFDIYIPALNLAIEHQSGKHANTETQFCDNTTELIAQQIGINLLEICLIDNKYPRTENQWCIIYKQRHEQEMIQKFSSWLNTNYNIHTNSTYPRSLEDQAYLNSCKVKYENSLAYHNPPFLKEWNYQLNGLVTPDKVSLNADRKYYWTCSICGHIYLSSPDNRNKGRACPNWKNHK